MHLNDRVLYHFLLLLGDLKMKFATSSKSESKTKVSTHSSLPSTQPPLPVHARKYTRPALVHEICISFI